jgi:hypothetical protein
MTAPDRPTVDQYTFGEVHVDDATHRDDLIVLPDRVLCPWRRKRGHRLQLVDLAEVLEASLDVLVVGTGYFGRMRVDSSVETEFARTGIVLVSAPTSEAIQRFSELPEDPRVALALHLTC